MSNRRAFIGYIPVISEASLRLLNRQASAELIGIVDASEIAMRALQKDARALPSYEIVELLQNRYPAIRSLGMEAIRKTLSIFDEVHMPDDEVTEYILKDINPKASVRLDRSFYRWNPSRALENFEINDITTINLNKLPLAVTQILDAHRNQSMDWWRTVAAATVDAADPETIILSAHNHYLPNSYSAEIDGDIRSNFTQGVQIESANAIHAEASLVSTAAKMGIPLQGLDVYVTTFPCPVCAKLLSETGIRRLFFYDGYSVGDGRDVLESAGVEMVKIVND